MTEKIVNKLDYFKYRDNPAKKIKYKEDPEFSAHLSNTKKKEEYQYYTCDYCGEEIRIEKDTTKRTGGLCVIPYSFTRGVEIELALHDKCLNPVLRELENFYNKK